uniref:C2 domain-containing protein n=1 Tax=Clastoptera arizonana TaxID=38151 RepID=A0A1B6CT46_9HEMI
MEMNYVETTLLDIESTTQSAVFDSESHVVKPKLSSPRDFVVLAVGVVSTIVLLLAVGCYSFFKKRKNPESDSLGPSIVVYPSYQGTAPQFFSKDIAFSLPQLRHSESLDDLVTEPNPVEEPESDVPSFVHRSYPHRSNSFSSYGLGAIDPALYQGTLNFEEDAEFPEDHLGRIWFSVRYEAASEKLLVSLMKVKNLPSRTVGTANNCDPVVRLWITPNGRRYQQSRQKKKTCNPYFDETFIFQVAQRELPDHYLKMSVTDTGRTRRRNAIGHISFPLRDLTNETTANQLTLHKMDLEKEVAESVSDLGELQVSLLYNENINRLTVSVMEARRLKFPDDRYDSYVRVTLNQQYRTVKVKRTTTTRGNSSPTYSQGFNFNIPVANIEVSSIVLQVYQAGANYGKDKLLGKCVLGSYMFARGKTLTHWNTAFANPMEKIQQWHDLCI